MRRINHAMKIAQIAPPWISIPPKQYGGTEAVISNLVEELVAEGHDVTLYTPESSRTSARQVSFFSKALYEDGVPWRAHLKAEYHMYKAIEDVKEQSFDIVHTHLSASPDLHIFPLTASLPTPHVSTLHSNFPFDHSQGWQGDADRYYMDWAAGVPVVTISESARKQVPYPLNFAGVVYNGISMQQYMPSGRPLGDFLMWFGRFSPEKGAHIAIEAAKRAQIPLIMGGTIDRSSKEAMRYFQDTIKPQVDNRQIRYLGPINLKQKVSYLSRARAFLNPIEWEEPFGMVMIEAMALGCPVISFARGAAPEVVGHGKTGFLVQNLDEMLERIPHIEEIDRAATRQHVEENFSARVMAHRYLKIYQQIIEQQRKSMPVQEIHLQHL